MPNAALALLDTVTEPAIAVERRDRCEWLDKAQTTHVTIGQMTAFPAGI